MTDWRTKWGRGEEILLFSAAIKLLGWERKSVSIMTKAKQSHLIIIFIPHIGRQWVVQTVKLEWERVKTAWRFLVFGARGGISYATIIIIFFFFFFTNGERFFPFSKKTEAMNIELSQSLKSDVFVFLSFSWKYDQWKSQSSRQEGRKVKEIIRPDKNRVREKIHPCRKSF